MDTYSRRFVSSQELFERPDIILGASVLVLVVALDFPLARVRPSSIREYLLSSLFVSAGAFLFLTLLRTNLSNTPTKMSVIARIAPLRIHSTRSSANVARMSCLGSPSSEKIPNYTTEWGQMLSVCGTQGEARLNTVLTDAHASTSGMTYSGRAGKETENEDTNTKRTKVPIAT